MHKIRHIIQDYSLLIIVILLAVLVISMAAFLFYGLEDHPDVSASYKWLIIISAIATLLGISIAMLGAIKDISALKRKDSEIVEKDAELQRFAYSVSHDLKSPLVTLKTFMDCLERDLAPMCRQEKVDQDLRFMRSSYQRMNELLDELFQLSRLGKRAKSVSLFSYEELVNEAIALVAGRITMRHAKIELCPDAMLLEGDKSQLLAVWQNLIENAVKYTDEREEPQIVIGVQKGKNPVFYVADRGLGIDRDDRERVFELFTKLDAKSEGTGFGLTLVKRIVGVYGGKIWVESAGLGYGSTFKYTLPRALSK